MSAVAKGPAPLYAYAMTLSSRNRLLLVGIAASVPVLAGLAFAMPEAIASALSTLSGAERRTEGLATLWASFFARPSAAAILASIPLSVVFASVSVALLYYSFEKTQAPEILFFAAFCFSLTVEAFRIAVPLSVARDWPPAIIVGAARSIAFGRFFGILSLFASGVFANGVEFQKHGRIFIFIAVAALTVATGIPVDGLAYDSSFLPLSGYRAMIELVELSLAVITVLSYIVAAYSRSAREFYAAAAGIAMIAIGRDLLLKGDSWLTLPVGVALLAGGTWLFTVRTHRYYLWL